MLIGLCLFVTGQGGPCTPQADDPNDILDPDGTVTVLAKEGWDTRFGFDTILGCGKDCTAGCGSSSGSGVFHENASTEPAADGIGKITFSISAPAGTDGNATSKCGIWSLPFRVEPRAGNNAQKIKGDVILDIVGKFTTAGANGYNVNVDVNIAGLALYAAEASVSHTFCYNVVTAGGSTMVLCNEPLSTDENLSLRISDFEFDRNTVYQAGVIVGAGITSGVGTSFGGDLSGEVVVSDLSICIDCEQ
jgi:hypothetical protein